MCLLAFNQNENSSNASFQHKCEKAFHTEYFPILSELREKEKESIKFGKVVRKSFLQINVYKVVEQLLDDFLLCSVPVWHHSSLPLPPSISCKKV